MRSIDGAKTFLLYSAAVFLIATTITVVSSGLGLPLPVRAQTGVQFISLHNIAPVTSSSNWPHIAMTADGQVWSFVVQQTGGSMSSPVLLGVLPGGPIATDKSSISEFKSKFDGD